LATKPKPRFLDFFAGSGLVTEALRRSFQPVWANDLCEKKAAVYRTNHPADRFRLGPIQDVRGADVPDAELSWASFPCQDLSLAGNMKGISSARSGLVWQWLRVMDEMTARPPVVVAENVVGLVAGAGGEHYRELHRALVERGYRVGALLIDAVHWLPQSRPRVFVVGADRRIPTDGLTGDGPTWCHNSAIRKAAVGLDDWVWWKLAEPKAREATMEDLVEPDAPYDPPEKARHVLGLIPVKHRLKMEAAVRQGTRVFPGYRRIREGRQVLELRFDGLAGCLRTPNGGSSRQVLVLWRGDHYETRVLTVREAARLMGARETYELPGSYNEGYWAMGDAVAVPAARHLARGLLIHLAKRA
jgi:DNA (cytosine-5)-methyltransferase 1